MQATTANSGLAAQADLQRILARIRERLPLTFLPFLNQELRRWESLFRFERRYVQRILAYLDSLNRDAFEDLFRSIRELEKRMGVGNGQFTTEDQTLENSALLARSPYYQEWRAEVNAIFTTIERNAPALDGTASRIGNPLIVLVFPARLPLDPATAWRHWGTGKRLMLDLSSNENHNLLAALFGAGGPEGQAGFLGGLLRSPGWTQEDIWMLDGSSDSGPIWTEIGMPVEHTSRAILLSFLRLKTVRENILKHLNDIRRDLADADSMMARVRKLDIERWLPSEVAADIVSREFVRELLLSGNGALNFPSSFVQWGASEAFRRVRPSVLIARFGTRNKPKPFTSVLVFANQEKINPLPNIEDLEGSALDAQVMSRYLWLAANRYPEYQRAACLCISENLPQVYLTAPPDFSLWNEREPIDVARLPLVLQKWITSSG